MKKALQGAVAGAIAIVTIVGGWIALDNHWVTLTYHNQCFAEMKQEIQTIQKTSLLKQTYDEIFFYSKMEIELTRASANHPGDQEIKNQLNRATENRKAAEKRLHNLKEK